MRRLQHLIDSKRWHAELWEKSAKFGLKRNGSWRSWCKHPVANITYRFWNNVPHLPTWELSETSIGSVNHERADADILFLADRCSRCGMHTNESRWVPEPPKDAA